MKNPVRKAIDNLNLGRGADAEVARQMGVDRQLIGYYVKTGRVSRHKALDFCRITGARLNDVLGLQ